MNLGLGDEETFTYDFSNRLRQYANASTSTTASYLYDPFGRRIRKIVDGTTTWFVWDGDQLLAEFDGSGLRVRRYAYAEGSAPVEQVDSGSPEVVSQVHVDHLDTPRALTSSSASEVWRGTYEAFGRVEVGAGSSVGHAMRFPGQYEDQESSLHYNRHRYYGARYSRFLSADSLGQDGDPNVYNYDESNPTAFSDPLGLTSALGPLLEGGLPPASGPDVYDRLIDGRFDVFREANRQTGQLPPGTPDGHRDAFRHCVAACMMAARYGGLQAALYGHFREIRSLLGYAQAPADFAMDERTITSGS